MSGTTVEPVADAAAERWRQWQAKGAAVSRRSAAQATTVFTVLIMCAVVWLVLQLLLR